MRFFFTVLPFRKLRSSVSHLSVQFSRSVMSDSFWPHELQYARLPCPSLSPRVYSNSCSLNRWCHPIISSSVTLFLSCPQSFPAWESLLMIQLFESHSQTIGASASALVLSVNIQDWFPLGLTCLISLLSKGLSRIFFSATVWKPQFFSALLSFWSNSYPYIMIGKTIALTIWTFISKVISLLFNMFSRFIPFQGASIF